MTMNQNSAYRACPAWADKMKKTLRSKTVSQFILYNNVRDWVPDCDPHLSEPLAYRSLMDYLTNNIFSDRHSVIFYDISKGIHFPDTAMQAEFFRTMQLTQQDLMRHPAYALKAIEIYIRLNLEKNKTIAIILDHAEMIAPMTLTSVMSSDDRKCIVMLNKWANDTRYMQAGGTIVLITNNLSDLNHRIVRNVTTEKIEIPYPDAPERLAYIQYFIREEKNKKASSRFESYSWLSAEEIAQGMAGLNYRQMHKLLAGARENGDIVDFIYLMAMKKHFIEEECFGLLEVLQPRFTLEAVAGYENIKTRLRQLARAIKSGHHDSVPMGYLFSGPVGAGKTFIVLSFVGEIGIPCVKFLNFREQWVGVTEANLEKILNLLKAMWPIGVIIDEADAFLGDRNEQGDSGTSNRVFAQLAAFMGDTHYRGKVIWFLITCRPDLLPVDMKRQGRAEEHIGIFYPETPEEKEELFAAMIQKRSLPLAEPVRLSDFFDTAQEISGADMEALIARVQMELSITGAPIATRENFKKIFDDFMSSNDPESIELQTLAAVLESTSRSLIPARFANMDRITIRKRFEELLRLERWKNG